MKRATLILLTTFLYLGVKSQNTLDSGLIAHYPMDSNTLDVSGFGHHLTNVNATLVSDRHGNPNRAYYFNGSTAYLHGTATAADFSVSNFAISFWIKPETQVNTNPRLVTIGPQSTYFHKYFCWIETGGYDTYGLSGLSSAGSYRFYQLSASKYSKDTWKHLVFMLGGDPASGTLTSYTYINGVLDKSQVEVTGVEAFTQDQIIQIGAAYHPSSPLGQYKGALDDVLIYKRLLTGAEIQDLYVNGRSTGLTEGIKQALSIFPNPGNSKIHIEGLNTGPAKYELISPLGQVILSGELSDNTIDISAIPAGTYFLRVNSPGNTFMGRICKVD